MMYLQEPKEDRRRSGHFEWSGWERDELTRMTPVKDNPPWGSRSSVTLIGLIICGWMMSERIAALGTVSIIRCSMLAHVLRNDGHWVASLCIVALL
jgi:hypothetical protein